MMYPLTIWMVLITAITLAIFVSILKSYKEHGAILFRVIFILILIAEIIITKMIWGVM